MIYEANSDGGIFSLKTVVEQLWRSLTDADELTEVPASHDCRWRQKDTWKRFNSPSLRVHSSPAGSSQQTRSRPSWEPDSGLSAAFSSDSDKHTDISSLKGVYGEKQHMTVFHTLIYCNCLITVLLTTQKVWLFLNYNVVYYQLFSGL